MQDVKDNELMEQYTYSNRSSQGGSTDGEGGGAQGTQQGFIVRDAPWSKAPDTNSMQDFPEFGTAAPKAAPPAFAWGPRRKR